MPKVILVDDESMILDAMTRCLDDIDADIYRFTRPADALDFLSAQKPDLIISDQRMPGMQGTEMLAQIKERWPEVQCVLVSAYNDFEAVAEAFNNNVIERYLSKPWDNDELRFLVDKVLQDLSEESEASTDHSHTAVERGDEQTYRSFHGMVTACSLMEKVFQRVEKAATANVPIFVTGETGTGKELIAKACHFESIHRDQPFVAVNCANFSENLIESQLFGHVKGAFTGADRDQKGLLEEAGNGTVFLDEITTLPLAMQAKLLRVIQEKEFSPLGSHKLKSFNAQLVSASSTSLREAVAGGDFREDLYYRLNVLVVDLPPLRARDGDKSILAEYLLQKLCEDLGEVSKTFSPEALSVIEKYSWPGNIRQLENFVQAVMALSTENTISQETCSTQLQYFSEVSDSPEPQTLSTPRVGQHDETGIEALAGESSPQSLSTDSKQTSEVLPLWLQEKQAIEEAIRACDGNIPRAAALLEVSPSTIYRKIQAWETKSSEAEAAK